MVGWSIVAAALSSRPKWLSMKKEGRRTENLKAAEALSTCCPARSWHGNHAGGRTHTAPTHALRQQHELATWMNFFSNHLLQATSELMKKAIEIDHWVPKIVPDVAMTRLRIGG
jgi:hypothetical protein